MFDPVMVKIKCNGMLPADVYQRIYDLARSAPGGLFVEVGAAHAAATVCLASALRDSGRQEKVYSFEKIVGGSRKKFGDFETNKRIIEENISFFGLSSHIVMNYGLVEDLARTIPEGAPLGLMMLDADGRIDRDFSLFFNSLVRKAVIVIDDVAPVVRVRATSRALAVHQVSVDQKHRISQLLVDYFVSHGMIEGEMVAGTWFGRKVGGSFEQNLWPGIVEQYRALVFASAPYELMPGGFRGLVALQAKRVLPEPVVQRVRRLIHRGRAK
jgi:predicted O-methyltransferase YrrM